MKKTRIVLWVVALTLALSGLYGCGKPAGGGTLNQTVEISFSTQSVRLVRGDERYGTQSLVAQVRKDGKDDETAAPVYAVENPAVASYADGVLTAVGKGKTVLTATLGEKSASVTVEVSEKIESLQISDRTHVKYYGRVFEQDGKQWFHNTASGFEVSFIGTTLSARLTVNKSAQTGLNELRKAGLKVYVDDLDPVISDCTTTGTTSVTLTLARDLPQGLHTVTVRKMTEQAALKCAVEAIECDGEFVTPKASAARKFEFYGDSITCGYGNLWTSDYNDLPDAEKYINDQDGTQTYVTMTSEYFGAEYSIVSYSGLSAALPVNGLDYTCYDLYDVYSESTRKKGTESYRHYDSAEYQADVVVINLGTNDANMIEKAGEGKMIDGYKKLLLAIRESQPHATIFCIYGMMAVVQPIEDCIVEAVEQAQSEGLLDVYYFRVDGNDIGTYGHPDMKGHTDAAETLIKRIERFAHLD